MLLYAISTKQARTWVLDLTGPPVDPLDTTGPSVYALVVPSPPVQVYIGSTKNLKARIRQHLTRSRTELSGRSRDGRRTSAAAVLARVLSGHSGLLVIRLESVPPDQEKLLRRLELAWLLDAAREEMPEARRRGPSINWSGEPGELRAAFALARHRRWPEHWIAALRPLCENKALPDRTLTRPPRESAPARRRKHRPKARPARDPRPQTDPANHRSPPTEAP